MVNKQKNEMKKITREATRMDIKQIQVIRNLVKENKLSNPDLVTDKDCEEFISRRGKGWVCEVNREVVGFAIADLKEKNVWALFLHPAFEKRGIGKQLHDAMLEWFFEQTNENIWLGTAPHTRAEGFYRKAGWTEIGMHGKKEIKFEMTQANWKRMKENAKNKSQ